MNQHAPFPPTSERSHVGRNANDRYSPDLGEVICCAPMCDLYEVGRSRWGRVFYQYATSTRSAGDWAIRFLPICDLYEVGRSRWGAFSTNMRPLRGRRGMGDSVSTNMRPLRGRRGIGRFVFYQYATSTRSAGGIGRFGFYQYATSTRSAGDWAIRFLPIYDLSEVVLNRKYIMNHKQHGRRFFSNLHPNGFCR